jgi:hypothetical protein
MSNRRGEHAGDGGGEDGGEGRTSVLKDLQVIPAVESLRRRSTGYNPEGVT